MAGSIARGDVDNVPRHLRALEELGGEYRTLYCTLALRSLPLVLGAKRITPARAAALRQLLESR
jgi:predicted short-subunit dehydrogenase-like oxidoreductase (DUF2520 family)